MILTDIKAYLETHKRVALMDIAYHFDVTPQAVEGLLAHWIRKGKVRRLEGHYCQQGCCQAASQYLTFYEWVSSCSPRPMA